MGHSHHRFDVGTNPERLIWAQIDRAIELPELVQRTSHTLTLTLGRDTLGWRLDSSSSRYQLRAGPALDLRYQSPTVTLTARQFPQRAAHIEREHPTHPAFGRFRVGLFERFFHLFTVTGVITDAVDGEVKFTLSASNLDAGGRFLLEPRVSFGNTGEEVVPRLLSLELIPSIV